MNTIYKKIFKYAGAGSIGISSLIGGIFGFTAKGDKGDKGDQGETGLKGQSGLPADTSKVEKNSNNISIIYNKISQIEKTIKGFKKTIKDLTNILEKHKKYAQGQRAQIRQDTNNKISQVEKNIENLKNNLETHKKYAQVQRAKIRQDIKNKTDEVKKEGKEQRNKIRGGAREIVRKILKIDKKIQLLEEKVIINNQKSEANSKFKVNKKLQFELNIKDKEAEITKIITITKEESKYKVTLNINGTTKTHSFDNFDDTFKFYNIEKLKFIYEKSKNEYENEKTLLLKSKYLKDEYKLALAEENENALKALRDKKSNPKSLASNKIDWKNIYEL